MPGNFRFNVRLQRVQERDYSVGLKAGIHMTLEALQEIVPESPVFENHRIKIAPPSVHANGPFHHVIMLLMQVESMVGIDLPL